MDESAIAHHVLALPTSDAVMEWLATHPQVCNVALVAALKKAVDTTLNQNTELAQRYASYAHLVAERVPASQCEEALMIAAWAMGNALSATATAAALEHYEHARSYAQVCGDRLALARLNSNIGSRLCQLGRYQEARLAIEDARRLCPDEMPPAVRSAIEQHYGVILDCMGESDAALEAYSRAAVLAETAEDYPRLLQIISNTALVYEQLGKLALAEQTYRIALDLACQHQQDLNEAKIAMNLGVLYTAQGRLADAQAMLQRAYEIFTQQDDAGDAACMQSYQAALYRMLGLADEAVALARAATATLEDLDWKHDQALALIELLRAQRQCGMYASAAASADAALALWEHLNNPLRSAHVLAERAALALQRHQQSAALHDAHAALERFAHHPEPRPLWSAPARRVEADVLRHTGHLEHARQIYLALIDEARLSGDHWTLQAALMGLGWLEFADGQSDAAYTHIAQAAANLEMVRRTLTAEELKARFLQSHSDVYDMLVTLAATNHNPAATLTAMLRAKGGGLLDIIQRERTAQLLPPAEQSELETLRQQLAWERYQVSQVDDQTSTSALEAHQRTIHEYEGRLLTLLRQRQQQEHIPDLATALTAADIARSLPSEVGVIEYYLTDDGVLWSLLLRGDGTCDVRQLGTWGSDEQELLAELDLLFLNTITRPAAMRAARPPALKPAHTRLHALWKHLIAPWGVLPSYLFIVPHRALGRVPFAALWDGSSYLTDTHTVALLPSAALLIATETHSPAETPASVSPPLVMGYSAGGWLPATTREAHMVGALLPAAMVYTEEEASSAVLRSLIAPPAVLHIAAHAALRTDAPLFSTVRLSDGDMALESWYDVPLRGTRLAVLSACDTGRVADQSGPLLAFQGALLGAGVQTLLSSLWQADDEATVTLMHHFYHRLLAGETPATALRHAQHALRAISSMSHPALWAPFICGGPGAYNVCHI